MIVRPLAVLAASMLVVACADKNRPTVAAGEVAQSVGEPRTSLAEYNLDEALGIHGYDPVSYFGGAPKRGSSEHVLRYRGVVYAFATAHNLATFEASPAKYEPAYGGWCAWAMAKGASKVDPDPEDYLLQGGRLMLFYRNPLVDTRKKWEGGDTAELEQSADQNWTDLTGEP